MRALIAFTFMVTLSVLTFVAQFAAADVAQSTGEPTPQFSQQNEFLEHYKTNNTYVVNTDTADVLPQTSGSFIDAVNFIIFPLIVFLQWIQGASLFVTAFLSAIPNFIMGIGLPAPFAWAIGVIWHSSTIMLLILAVVK